MKTLIPVDGWVTNDTKNQGKYLNEQGLGLSGFYRRDFKFNSDMVVLSNGHFAFRYKYPRGFSQIFITQK